MLMEIGYWIRSLSNTTLSRTSSLYSLKKGQRTYLLSHKMYSRSFQIETRTPSKDHTPHLKLIWLSSK